MKKLQEYFKDLSDYKDMQKSQRCDLNTRYFEQVFKLYPGLRSPISLMIKDKKGSNLVTNGKEKEKMFIFHTERNKPLDKNHLGIVRLTVKGDSDSTIHSNLLIIDYDKKILYRLEPLGNRAPHFEDVNNFLKQMKKDYELVIKTVDGPKIKCDRGGYSVAYCIFYAYSFLSEFPFEPEYIKQFVNGIKNRYGLPKADVPEIEYDLFGDGNGGGGVVVGVV